MKFVRDSIGENTAALDNEGTADVIAGIIQTHKEIAWMLKVILRQFYT